MLEQLVNVKFLGIWGGSTLGIVRGGPMLVSLDVVAGRAAPIIDLANKPLLDPFSSVNRDSKEMAYLPLGFGAKVISN